MNRNDENIEHDGDDDDDYNGNDNNGSNNNNHNNLSTSCLKLLWTTVCRYRCFHERQSYKRARPIGWLGSNERKYCQL